jgi:hypothetical protein
MPIGVLALAAALLIERFLPSNDGFDFISGFLIGISLVFNISYLASFRKNRKDLDHNRVNC